VPSRRPFFHPNIDSVNIGAYLSGMKTKSEARSYHHGDLRAALLAEAERMLEREGRAALTLRAIARAAGVSHAAPANHFGDLTGLLSELAADGHRRMDAEVFAKVDAAGPMLGDRAKEMGKGYVAFARDHPGLFGLMYQSEKLDPERPALKAALAKKRLFLRNLLSSRPGAEPPSSVTTAAQATALWSLVHGYAMLMLDGRLVNTLAGLPEPHTPESFLRIVLESVTLTKKQPT
jgi:AcrR family transcriptional regulator